MAQKKKVLTVAILALLISATSLGTLAQSSKSKQSTVQLVQQQQQALNQSMGIKADTPDYSQYDYQILISAGMPDGVLRSLFAQAAAYGPEKVRFIIRGFPPKRLGETIAHFRNLFPDPAKDFVIVDIDPNVFRYMKAKSVPVYLVKDSGDKWWEVRGELSLRGAKEYIKRPDAPIVAGQLHAITEPDTIELLEAQGKATDWRAIQQRLQTKAMTPQVQAQTVLPLSGIDRKRIYRPFVELHQDVVVPDPSTGGERVLAKAGDKINPLQHNPFEQKIAIVSAEDPRQIKWLEGILRQYGRTKVDVFFTGSADWRDLTARFAPARVWPLWQYFADTFGVQSVPSMLSQQGDAFLIEEFSVNKLGR